MFHILFSIGVKLDNVSLIIVLLQFRQNFVTVSAEFSADTNASIGVITIPYQRFVLFLLVIVPWFERGKRGDRPLPQHIACWQNEWSCA